MNKLFLDLIVVSIDWISGQMFVLSEDKDYLLIPTTEGEFDTQPEDLVRSLFSKYSHLSPNWLTLNTLATKSIDNNIHVIYQVVIPYDTTIIDSYWLKCHEVDKEHALYDELVLAIRNIR